MPTNVRTAFKLRSRGGLNVERFKRGTRHLLGRNFALRLQANHIIAMDEVWGSEVSAF
jgi:hypothetical protein